MSRLFKAAVDLFNAQVIKGAKTFIDNLIVGMDGVTDRTITVGFNGNNRVRLGFENGVPFISGKDNDNTTGFLVINDAGGVCSIGHSLPTAAVDVAASTTARSAFRIRSGVAPTTPNDGDIWYDGTALKIRIGGITRTVTVT